MSGKKKRVKSCCSIQINPLCAKSAMFKITLHKMMNITTGSVANASNHLQPSVGMTSSETMTINVDPSAQKNWKESSNSDYHVRLTNSLSWELIWTTNKKPGYNKQTWHLKNNTLFKVWLQYMYRYLQQDTKWCTTSHWWVETQSIECTCRHKLNYININILIKVIIYCG